MRRQMRFSALILALALFGACKKSEAPKETAAAKPAPAAAAPGAAKPAPARGKTVAKAPPPPGKKPAARPKPAEAGRKAADKPITVMKDIVDINSPEVTGEKLPAIVYFYANWSPHDKRLMGVVEDIALEYQGRAKFFRVDVNAAMKAKTVPKDVVAFPYLVFLKGDKRLAKSPGHPGEDAKKTLTFFIEEWVSGDDDDDL